MTTNILVIGLQPVHAGKTTLAQAILSYLKKENHSACGFKPFSGNNIWYHFDMLSKTLAEGRIYSKDAYVLKQASEVDIPVESLNPIHRVWNEPATMDPVTGLPHFIMDRITSPGPPPQQRLVINHHAMQHIPDKMKKILDQSTTYKKHIIQDVDSLNQQIQAYYQQSVENAYHALEHSYDAIIIESYADQALGTWAGEMHYDGIIGIRPWQILCYDPSQYEKAVQLTKSSYSWEISTTHLADLLTPIETILLQPVTSSDIPFYLQKKISPFLHTILSNG